MTDSKIKLVVTDLDGTLLCPDRRIENRAIALINYLKDKGIYFTAISGRPPYAVKNVLKGVNVTAPLVCCNGAVIEQNERVLKQSSFGIRRLIPVLNHAKMAGMTVLIYSNKVEYTLSNTEWIEERIKNGRNFPIMNFNMYEKEIFAEKINIMSDGNIDEFLSLLPDLLYDENISVSVYSNDGCEIIKGGINKSIGLDYLVNYLNIDTENVLAIGDNENDIEMIKAAGIGVAVGNATDSLKSVADFICHNKYSYGVIEAIKKYCI